MKQRLSPNKFFIRTLSVLIALAILLTVVPVAYAESTGPLTPIPGLGRLPNETLIRMHKKVGGWFNEQEALFVLANKLSGNFQALIDAEAQQGKNVAILQEALVIFNSELTACREIHSLAGTTIFSLVGWKSNGDVRDRLAAGQSLLDARDTLKDSQFRLIDAMAALRKSFAKWRGSRIHGIPLPTATVTPKP